MPKRMARNKYQFNKGFHRGYSQGVTAANFAWQMTILRKNNNLTLEQLAEKSGVSIEKLKDVENYSIYGLDIKDITNLAKTFDCGCDITYKSFSQVNKPVSELVDVPSFKEEIESIETTKES